MKPTRYAYILLDEQRIAHIADTGFAVAQLVIEQDQFGWSAEELHFQHPSLSLGQIYSALAYYADHQQGIDRQIETSAKEVQQLYKNYQPSPLFRKLSEHKKSRWQ